MAKTLTNFLIALNDSIKLRDKYRNPEKHDALLAQWGLADEPALRGDGDISLMQERVTAETGIEQVEWWIRASGEAELNADYNPGV